MTPAPLRLRDAALVVAGQTIVVLLGLASVAGVCGGIAYLVSML